MYIKYNNIYKYIKHIFIYLVCVCVFVCVCACVCACVCVCVCQRTINLSNYFLTVKQEHCICYYINMFNKSKITRSCQK